MDFFEARYNAECWIDCANAATLGIGRLATRCGAIELTEGVGVENAPEKGSIGIEYAELINELTTSYDCYYLGYF